MIMFQNFKSGIGGDSGEFYILEVIFPIFGQEKVEFLSRTVIT